MREAELSACARREADQRQRAELLEQERRRLEAELQRMREHVRRANRVLENEGKVAGGADELIQRAQEVRCSPLFHLPSCTHTRSLSVCVFVAHTHTHVHTCL